MAMEPRLVRDLQATNTITDDDYVVGESRSGTKRFPVKKLAAYTMSALTFNTVADMQKAMLEENTIVSTLGYKNVNDGAAGTYVITYEPAVPTNGGTVIGIHTNYALRARLIHSNTVTVDQFGAAGDGVTDDSTAIQNAVNSGCTVIFTRNKKYKLTAPVKINEPVHINVEYATLIPYNGYAFEVAKGVHDVTIDYLMIDASNKGRGVKLSGENNHIKITGCGINGLNFKCAGIYAVDPIGLTLDSVHFGGESSEDNVGTHGLYVEYTKDFAYDSAIMSTLVSARRTHSGVYVYNGSEGKGAKSIHINGLVFEAYKNDDTMLTVDAIPESGPIMGNVGNINIRGGKAVSIGASVQGTIRMDNMVASNITEGFDVLAADLFHLSLTGTMAFYGDDVHEADRASLFKTIACNLYTSCEFFVNQKRYKGFNDQNRLLGTLTSNNFVYAGKDIVCNYETSKILCELPVNACYDWVGDLVLSEIVGCEGQVIAVKSSTGQEVTSNGNIIVYPDDRERIVKEPLPTDYYYIFKCINGKWIRIKEG